MREAEPFYLWWDRMTTPPESPEPPEPSLWDIEKSSNRLRRQVERLENGRWLPRLGYKLNRGMVKRVQREVEESHQLLGEAADVLAEAKHG